MKKICPLHYCNNRDQAMAFYTPETAKELFGSLFLYLHALGHLNLSSQ